MTEPIVEAIRITQAEERLRQERETFNQRKKQDERWFLVRLTMAWISAAILPMIAALCAWIILNHSDFTRGAVTAATLTLLVDTFGLVVSVWRIVLGKGPQVLIPVTGTESNDR